jgi:hypothetical protein
MAEQTTGQLDKLIEKKIDDNIAAFVHLAVDSISHFLKDNGDYNGEHLYTVSEWDKDRTGSKIPKSFSHDSMHIVKKGLIAGISKQVKDKMIAKATKELLDKVSLLS